jgi:hypothetical protein
LPPLSRSTSAEGLVSFDLGENRVPLADPRWALINGRLTLHRGEISPGPVLAEIVKVVAPDQPRIVLPDEQTVPIKVENQRVYHDGLAIKVGRATVRTSGSAGIDGTLALVAEFPLPKGLFGEALRRNSRIEEFLSNRRVRIPIGGTLSQPRLDGKRLQEEIRSAGEEFVREAAKEGIGRLLDKGKERLEKKLMENNKTPSPPPK